MNRISRKSNPKTRGPTCPTITFFAKNALKHLGLVEAQRRGVEDLKRATWFRVEGVRVNGLGWIPGV